MARSPFSPHWHSVAALKPRLMAYAVIRRMVFRGKPWYSVQDQAGGKVYRFSLAAYELIAAMDGQTTVHTLWERANSAESRDACTQPEVVDLLMQLHGANLLQTDTPPDSAASLEKKRKQRWETPKQWLLNPMSLKIPLLNPDAFLTRYAGYLGWCFGPWGLLLWLAVVLPAGFLAVQNWGGLTHNLSDQVFSSSNLLVMLMVYPIVKLLHELGHGVATKHWGGAVRELGLMFLIFAPVPYVEVSSSAAIVSKYRRAVVAAAGMLVELFLAAIALYVWLLVEPGIARAVAFNVMVISGVSTLVVNGNPLLRYDGYYILSDLIEIPNLAQRGQAWWTYLLDRYGFGAHEAVRPDETMAESRWLTVYTPLAWCYRTFVTVGMIFIIANQFFVLGVVLACWSAYGLIGSPVLKSWKHLSQAASLRRRRSAAMRRTFGLLAVLALLLLAVPVPLHTRAEGVVWLPDQAILHAGENGFFNRWLTPPGTSVETGALLYQLDNPGLKSELAVDQAKVAQAQARYDAEHFSDVTKAGVSKRQLDEARDVLVQAKARAARLTGRSNAVGQLIIGNEQDMPGRYFKKGELLGYVLQDQALLVRVVVQQDDIDLVHQRKQGVSLRLADSLGEVHESSIVREFPGGVEELPTAALGLNGGGTIATRPGDADGLKTLTRVFIVDLALPPDTHAVFGERAQVRFDHGKEPLGVQAWRRLRQVFLSHFNV